MGIVKARKLRDRSKIFLFSKTEQYYENRSADICPAGSWAGTAISICGSYDLYVLRGVVVVVHC